VEAFRTTGVWLPIGAFVVMAAPLLVGFVAGRVLLGFDPVILIGALTSTPALDLVNRQADSPLPTVGYAGTYAFANVLLAIAGSLLMRF
jgi:putative transport protein